MLGSKLFTFPPPIHLRRCWWPNLTDFQHNFSYHSRALWSRRGVCWIVCVLVGTLHPRQSSLFKLKLPPCPSQTFSHITTPTFSTPDTLHPYPPMKMEQCSETSAYKIQTPGNYPEESIQQSYISWDSLMPRKIAYKKKTELEIWSKLLVFPTWSM